MQLALSVSSQLFEMFVAYEVDVDHRQSDTAKSELVPHWHHRFSIYPITSKSRNISRDDVMISKLCHGKTEMLATMLGCL